MASASFVTPADARLVEVPYPKPFPGLGRLDYFFGENGVAAAGPQAFLMHYETGIESRAHFHHVDQYHVFFGTGEAAYQRTPFGELAVLYTDADSVYGPFGSRGGSLSAFVLRPRGSDFIGHLPERRDELDRSGPKRVRFLPLGDWAHAPLPAAHRVEARDLVTGERDGVAASAIAAGPGAPVDLTAEGAPGGRYLVVVAGSLSTDGEELPERSLGWCPAGAPLPRLTAGDRGARLLSLGFLNAGAG